MKKMSFIKFIAWLAILPVIFLCVICHLVLALIDVPAHFIQRWVMPDPIVRAWSWNNLLSWSQKFNVYHGGDPDETFSSRVGKNVRRGDTGLYWRFWNWFLNFFEDNHAGKSIEPGEGDAQIFKD